MKSTPFEWFAAYRKTFDYNGLFPRVSDDESSNIRPDLGLGCEVASCPCSAGRTWRSQAVMCRAGCGNLCAPSGFGLTAEQDDGWAWVSLPVVALSNWVSLTRCSLRYMTAFPCWPSGCLVPRSTCIRDPSDLRASPAVHVGCEPAFGSFGRRCRKLLRGRNSMMPP